jgi:uncharacterized protein YcaQ
MPAPFPLSTAWLRRQAIGWSLRRSRPLAEVVAELEFVQYDPIRAPARAQDLILRPRVTGYREGDLDRAYPRLDVDEDYLYAYGFVARRLRPLLHPRVTRRRPEGYVPEGLAADVLAFVREHGVTHPRDVQAEFGTAPVVNDWGGRSRATTRALDLLHHFGLLRVVRRDAGIRVYEPAPPLGPALEAADRLRQLMVRIARTLAPVPESSLRQASFPLQALVQVSGAKGGRARVIRDLVAAGELESAEIDGVQYVWPADLPPVDHDPPERVRLLAPFDPVVWDRRRFEHLWDWAYRFEAYVPPARRQLGYYAMPLLWRDRVVGWANCGRTPDGAAVDVGFVDGRPRSKRFAAALDAEIARLETFLRQPVSR